MSSFSTENAVREALHEHGIGLCISVPCKYIAQLLTDVGGDQRFKLIFPSREEEGLGIAAGAHLAGRGSVMLIQNSGLGNMVNAYCSLNLYYDIPLCLIITHRGDELEKIPAQAPMGSRTEKLLDLLGIQTMTLRRAEDLPRLKQGLERYANEKKSVAFLTKKTFWNIS